MFSYILYTDAFSQDYIRILNNAYIPTEVPIFSRIRRSLTVEIFEDARQIREKDLERAASRPRFRIDSCIDRFPRHKPEK